MLTVPAERVSFSVESRDPTPAVSKGPDSVEEGEWWLDFAWIFLSVGEEGIKLGHYKARQSDKQEPSEPVDNHKHSYETAYFRDIL